MDLKPIVPRMPNIRSKLFRDRGRTPRLGVTASFNGEQFAGSVPVDADARTSAGDIAGMLETLAAFIRRGA